MNILPMYGIIILVVGLVFWRRTKEMVHPIKGSGVKILIPILYLSPLLYVLSTLHAELKIWEISAAAFIGVLLSIPLMWTSNYEIRQDGQIYAQKNKTFFFALLAVVVIRIAFRPFFSGMDPASTALLFYTVALSYIVPWRITSFIKFKRLNMLKNMAKRPRGQVQRFIHEPLNLSPWSFRLVKVN